MSVPATSAAVVMSEQIKRTILHGHERRGKRIVPPLLKLMGNRRGEYSWASQIVPELIWISLLQDICGERRGVELAWSVVERAATACSKQPSSLFASITSFEQLTDDEKRQVAYNLPENMKQEIYQALTPLRARWPDISIAFLFPRRTSDENLESATQEHFANLLGNLYNRSSRAAVMTMATAFYLGLRQGKIVLPRDLAEQKMDDFRAVQDYPESEASKRAASSFRAAVPFIVSGGPNGCIEHNNDWLDAFWSKVRDMGACQTSEPWPAPEAVPHSDPLEKLVFSFRNASRRELKERLDKWNYDLNDIEKFEVVGALLARQTSLANELALSPNSWTGNTAPLVLRAMADVFIALMWILRDPSTRAKQFIEDGLGAVKLEIAHRQAALSDMENEEDRRIQMQMIEHWKQWMEIQRIDAMVEVNLGSWSGRSTRKMAEEAGCLDFYNYVYQPFSNTVHSSWAHVGNRNVVFCENPAHRLHRLPMITDEKPDFHYMYLAAKYLDKTFVEFDKFCGIDVNVERAFDVILADIDGNEPSTDEDRA